MIPVLQNINRICRHNSYILNLYPDLYVTQGLVLYAQRLVISSSD